MLFNVMDQEKAIAKAREFTNLAHGVEIEKLSRQYQEKVTELHAELAHRGILMSGTTVRENSKLQGERITAMIQSRLNVWLEGLDLHGVTITDGVRDALVAELTALRSHYIANANEAMKSNHVLNSCPGPRSTYESLLEQCVGMHYNEIRTQIDRRRFMQKKAEGTTSITVYHVTGNNNRWLTNSQDYSVNVVTQSSDQIFANLRQEIQSKVPGGDEQKDILERLAALEEAQESPSFRQRYTEFIASAANHMQLLCPFIPALTEILQKHIV